MSQRFVRFVPVLAVLAALSVPARAQDCDSVVVDQAGLFKNGSAVLQAAETLASQTGADVRVRTWRSLGDHSTLTTYVKEVRMSCPSWQNSANNDIRSNLIVIGASLEPRRLGIIAGADFAATADAHHLRIEQNLMGPRFKQKPKPDFDGGFIAGMEEFGRVAYAQLHPPVYEPRPYTAPAERPAPAAPPVVVQTQPTDFTGLWSFLKWGLLAAVLAGIIWFLVGILRERERRRAAQQRAQSAKTQCSGIINDGPGQLDLLDARVAGLKSKVSEEDIGPVITAMASARQTIGDATIAFGDLQTSITDPSRPGLSVAEYGEIERVYTNLFERLKGVRTDITVNEETMSQLDALIRTVPDKVAGAFSALEVAGLRVDAVAKQSFNVDELAQVVKKKALSQAEKARTALQEKHYRDAASYAKAAADTANGAAADAESLPKRRQTILDRTTALTAGIEGAKAAIIAARGVFDRISAEYAETCWTSIKGNGTEATNRVNLALKQVGEATEASTMDRQDWTAAEAALDKGDKAVEKANSIVRSITELATSLDQAKKDAKRDVAAAFADLTKSVEYNKTNDADVDDAVWAKLKDAESKLNRASTELKEAKPDYFLVIKLAKEAHELADATLTQARTEHEAAERLRQKAANALRDATSRTSKAKEYIDDHRSDVGKSAKDKLEDAQDRLAKAKKARDLESQITLAEEAESFAKKAYDKAVEDVDEAEEARRPKYRSNDSDGDTNIFVSNNNWGSSWPSSPSPGHSGSSDSSWSTPSISIGGSGGGDSNWGGGGGGGGASGGGDSAW